MLRTNRRYQVSTCFTARELQRHGSYYHSFRGMEAGSVEVSRSGEICSIIFNKRCAEHKQVGVFNTISKTALD